MGSVVVVTRSFSLPVRHRTLSMMPLIDPSPAEVKNGANSSLGLTTLQASNTGSGHAKASSKGGGNASEVGSSKETENTPVTVIL